ncbi:MAG TPA: hypothetical protein PLH81_00005 [Niabella sp.]|nr:hypothetical protein [Niabella sp.]
MNQYKYAAFNEAPIFESVENGKGKKPINKLLLGTYVKIVQQDSDWYKVVSAGPDGWMHANSLSDNMGLKIFFLDVGQGDGVLMEIGKYKILIDAGPNNCMHNYLTKWQYKYLIAAKTKIHIDYLIVSHFDTDHYKGFIPILNNPQFSFGTIVHAGILKFANTGNPYNTSVGNTVKKEGDTFLSQVFDDILSNPGTVPFNRDISSFVKALTNAKEEGRLNKVKRYEQGDTLIKENIEGQPFEIRVLAPILEKVSNKKMYRFWTDEGKTINGNSLVLKVNFGNKTALLGGDLNSNSQEYLMGKYGAQNPFEVDVAKSCHHGSSDFSEDFMAKVNAFATVISSGDNEGYGHPRADAIGCAGKYSKSKRPLVYSTELARSTDLKNNKILFGMINLRCNGSDIFMSQMKEKKTGADIWDSYEVK